MKISVLIVTRNRGNILDECLKSLVAQKRKAFEVIVVDNNSTDNTKAVVNKFKKELNIKYIFESKIGLPFGRNTSIFQATGEICAFVDDDCILSDDWVSEIILLFTKNKDAVGMIGKTYNQFPENIYSNIEYVYYLRWLSENVENSEKTSRLKSGQVIDFKNCAFRTSFMKDFLFSTNVPFGDVGDEDVELGIRMFRKNKNIFLNPKLNVFHRYSLTLNRLLVRNFWNGYSNKLLESRMNITLTRHHESIARVYTFEKKTSNKQSFLIAVYPLFSKFGKLAATCSGLMHYDFMPVRR